MTIPEDFGQATLEFAGFGCPTGAATTFGFANATSLSAGQCADEIADSMSATTMSRIWSGDCTLINVHVKLGPDDTGDAADHALSIVGTAGAASSGPAVATLARKQTSLGGRRGRGRMYWPCSAEADTNDDGTVIAASVTAIQAVLTSWLGDLLARDLFMVVLHDNADPPVAVTGLICSSLTATQRRRLRR